MKETTEFRNIVLAYYKKHARSALPWRKTRDPYKILISEIMLQQTQVERVVPFFRRFTKRFPTVRSLAKATLADVLKEWSGLGYNRRAKMLHECAKEIIENHDGRVPKNAAVLRSLPGIGPYTAGAIRAFAFDEPDVFIETNIRAALIYHFFPRAKKISDAKLVPLLKKMTKDIDSSREWYAALMDYGTHIKKTTSNPSRRSAHHVKQSKFEGSLRQARGAILRKLLEGPIPHSALLRISIEGSYRIEQALCSLEREGLIRKVNSKWCLSN